MGLLFLAGILWDLRLPGICICENSLGIKRINRNNSPTSINQKNSLRDKQKYLPKSHKNPVGFVAPGVWDGTKSQPAKPPPDILMGKKMRKFWKINKNNNLIFLIHHL